jgi:hypothetical protein
LYQVLLIGVLGAAALSTAAAGQAQRDPRSASGTVTSAPPAKTAPSPAPGKSAATLAEQAARLEREEVMKVFDTWLRAWNARDMEAYFAVYAKEFRPADGESRDAWERRRRIRISNKSYINVRAEVPEVSVQENRATISFVQVYLSDKLRDESKKVLLLAKARGKWEIVQERAQR